MNNRKMRTLVLDKDPNSHWTKFLKTKKKYKLSDRFFDMIYMYMIKHSSKYNNMKNTEKNIRFILFSSRETTLFKQPFYNPVPEYSMGALNSMPLWRGRRPMDRDGYWEEGGVEAISGALLAYPVLRQTLFFVSKFSIILLSVFLFFYGGRVGMSCFIKKINTSNSFVCFSVFLVFDTPLFQTICDNSAPGLLENVQGIVSL